MASAQQKANTITTPAHVPSAGGAGRWARRLRLLAVPILLIALLADVLWFGPFDQTAAAPARSPQPLPLAALDPFGAHVFLEREVDRFKKDKSTELLAQSGLRWIRQEFPWSELEFKKGVYVDDKNNVDAWAKFDDIVQRATDNGLQVIARLDRAPDWARRPGADAKDPNYGAPPQNFADFGEFVATFVQHYKGRIHFLQIWNEPNLDIEWDDSKPVNPQEYVALLKVAADSARKVDPNIVILSAPLAPTNEDFEQNNPPNTRNLRETVYLDEMYAAGAAPYFDILSANAFGYNDPPEADPAPDTYNFRRVELSRAVMEKHGDTQKPVWFTEYAWDAPDTHVVVGKDILWGQVTLEQQADYTIRGIRYARAHWPWAGVFIIWYFRQVGDIPPSRADYYFDMVTPEFVPQPVYRAVQAESAATRVAGVGTYGPLSTPIQPGPGWTVQIGRDGQDASAPLIPLLVSQPLTGTTGTTNPGPPITITFRGTDLTVLLGAAPDAAAGAARLYVTVDGSTSAVSADLQRDESGRPYINLAAGGSTDPAPITADHVAAPLPTGRAIRLVSSLGSQRAAEVHQVQLRAAGAGAAIAGFTVSSERSYLSFAVVTSLLLALLASDLTVLLRRRTARP